VKCKTITLLVVLLLSMVTVGTTGDGEDTQKIQGIWLNEDGRAKIEIFDCSGNICGRIVWLKEPNYPPGDKSGMGGKPRVDLENPDPELRRLPLLGLVIMKGFDRAGGDAWSHGTIYDPVSGDTYRAKITLESPHRLLIRGYVMIPLFGKTTVWTR